MLLCVAGCFRGCPSRVFQSGRSSFNALGSMTAPESMCDPGTDVQHDKRQHTGPRHSPTSPPFSSTTTRTSRPFSCSSCFKRMAALRPAGPPPTIQTSTSSEARSTLLGSKSSLLRATVECSGLTGTKRNVRGHLRAVCSILLASSCAEHSLRMMRESALRVTVFNRKRLTKVLADLILIDSR